MRNTEDNKSVRALGGLFVRIVHPYLRQQILKTKQNMTREEILKAIATTSGFVGVEEFEYCENIHDMNRFIDWYKENISFCSQAGKELGANVISQLIV